MQYAWRNGIEVSALLHGDHAASVCYAYSWWRWSVYAASGDVLEGSAATREEAKRRAEAVIESLPN